MRSNLDQPTVGDYMVRNPICAELWQPLSFIRQQMLANSFSFLPVKSAAGWCLVSDLEIAPYLGTDFGERRKRFAKSLATAGIPLRSAKCCGVATSVTEALRMLEEDQRALLVCGKEEGQQSLVGIVTPFDLL